MCAETVFGGESRREQRDMERKAPDISLSPQSVAHDAIGAYHPNRTYSLHDLMPITEPIRQHNLSFTLFSKSSLYVIDHLIATRRSYVAWKIRTSADVAQAN